MKRQSAQSVLAEVQRLSQYLPVLGGVLGVVALSMAGINIATHLVRDLIGNGGDVTALVTIHLQTLAVVSERATVWGQSLLALFGL